MTTRSPAPFSPLPSPSVNPNDPLSAAGERISSHSSQSSISGHSASSSRTISRHPSLLDHPTAGSTIAKPDHSEQKIVVAMVGLPARGKSYLSTKLMRYLRWLEFEVKVFNVGQLRRKKNQQRAQLFGVKDDQSADFFDPKNEDAQTQREEMAAECLDNLINWLKTQGGNVGIHDATNSTRARRAKIAERVAREPGLKLLFLESICTDPAVIDANINFKVSAGDPDYDGMEREAAKQDFRNRIKKYEDSYETIDPALERNITFCKILNVGHQVTSHRVEGYLQSRIVFYLMNLHLTPRAIFFSRHGESQFNLDGKIGGDSDLSERGQKYAAALPQLVKENIGDAPLTVWTSTLRRTIQTAENLPYPKLTWKSLDELDAGVCDGMTYEEIEEAYPEDYAARDDDKFFYRYRGGESYRDVVVRLEPVIMELERQENILLVCHQAVLRCLYAYFHNLSQDELPYLRIPLHTVIKLTPKAYGCDEQRFALPIEAVDTTRPRQIKRNPATPVEQRAEDDLPPSMRKPQVTAEEVQAEDDKAAESKEQDTPKKPEPERVGTT